MKNYSLLLIALFLSNLVSSQTIQQLDSVTVKMCETIENMQKLKQEVLITKVFHEHLSDFYKHHKIESQKKADSISERIYFRLQRNCRAFSDFLAALEENKSDWTTLKQIPENTIDEKECVKFFKGGNFYYKEFDGKIVNVKITRDSWLETFEDTSISKLSFKPKNNCEFDVIFIESDNKIRKNFSVKGDVYSYGLYSTDGKSYNVWALGNDKVIYSFRLYKKK